MEEVKGELAGFEGAQGGNKEDRIEIDYLQDTKTKCNANSEKLRDDPEERKDSKNIENNQIFSNVLNSEFKKKSQKTLEFFRNL